MNLNKIDENNFIYELNRGNEAAMHYVIDNYAWIFKTVISKNLRLLPDYMDDCMNDCLMAVWENIGYYDMEKSSFKNWLGGIAKYKCIDYKRKYLKECNYENIDDLELADKQDIEQDFIKKEVNKEVESMLNALSEVDKEIFIKFYLEEKKVAEIATSLGLSEDIIYKRLSRGRKKLRTKFLKFKRYEYE